MNTAMHNGARGLRPRSPRLLAWLLTALLAGCSVNPVPTPGDESTGGGGFHSGSGAAADAGGGAAADAGGGGLDNGASDGAESGATESDTMTPGPADGAASDGSGLDDALGEDDGVDLSADGTVVDDGGTSPDGWPGD